jgi:hypothetical protein
MKKLLFTTALILGLFASFDGYSQEIQTLFKSPRPSGGYAAISNKFTTIDGEYANLAEIYGGWFIKQRLLVGVGAAASTNDIRVPREHSINPFTRTTWQYGQFGLMTEYVFWSNKAIHFNVTLFGGAGFTLQYERDRRYDWDRWDDDWDDFDDDRHDLDFFPVLEPGVQLEVNLLRWLRLSPGVSYRNTFGSDGRGLGDSKLRDWSYNVTLKIGKF